MQQFYSPMELLGRILLGAIFVMAGIEKFSAIDGTVGYLASAGMPGFLGYPAAILELVAGLAVIVGYQTRIAALLLAAFCLITAFTFHFKPADPMQMIMFSKNLAIAGGFLVLAHAGAGPLSVDGRRR